MADWVWVGAGVLGLVGVSYFFALAESALFSLGRWRLDRLLEAAPGLGGRVEQLLKSPQDLLATIVLGSTFANAGAVALTLWAVLGAGGDVGVVLGSLAVLVVVLVVVGEVIPKTLAVRSPVRWSVRVARPMSWLVEGLQPLHRVAQGWANLLLRWGVPKSAQPVPGLSDREYQELAEMAWQSGKLGAAEKEIIHQILQLDQRTARDVLLPRAQMACLADDLTIDEMRAAARRHRHRRLPVYDETPDTIVGVLNTRELLLNEGADLEDVLEFPSFVPASMNLLQLLRSLQRQQRGMAIVLDEYGGTAGLVTQEDILESLIGEFRDEGEEQGFLMERVSEGRWRVNATLRLDDFRREYPSLTDVPEVETLGGMVVHVCERVPEVGHEVVHDGLRIKVTAADERRVRQLLVETVARKGGR